MKLKSLTTCPGGWIQKNEINAILNSVEVKVEDEVELGNNKVTLMKHMYCIQSKKPLTILEV